MGFWDDAAKRRWMKEGTDEPVPAEGIARYWFLLRTHAGKLIAANLLFLLFSLPLVTLPGSLSALNRVCVKLVKDGNCLLWPEFIEEFRASFASGLLLGLPLGALLAASYYLLSLGISNSGTLYSVLFSALGCLALLFCASFGSWAFVLRAMLALPNRDIRTNARILSLVETKRTAAAVAIQAVLVIGTFSLFPLSLVLVLFLFPALGQFSIVSLYYPPVRKRIVAPFEAAQAERAGADSN